MGHNVAARLHGDIIHQAKRQIMYLRNFVSYFTNTNAFKEQVKMLPCLPGSVSFTTGHQNKTTNNSHLHNLSSGFICNDFSFLSFFPFFFCYIGVRTGVPWGNGEGWEPIGCVHCFGKLLTFHSVLSFFSV